jgi:YD repeat-containing protein
MGLQSSSLGLGQKGQIGNAAFGQGGEQLYVNAANGNLVIRDRDELLLGQGIASELYRAYNSQGQLQGDNWRPGVSRTVDGLTGTLNTAGSTITRTDWDGSTVVYAYDTAQGAYVATTGQGARDTLRYNASNQTWTWTQGSTRVTETYDATHAGRITATIDTSGNRVSYAYNAQNLLSSVTTASGEITYLDYNGTQLTQLRTVLKTADGKQSTQTAVRYSYDNLGRLSQVTVDLSPDDNSIADGKVYTTTYTYDGCSSRIASITASDGSKVAFSYQLIDGEYRVTQIAETSDIGVVRTTTLRYDIANGITTVTDTLGQATVLHYDSAGRLTQLDSPAVDGVVNSQRFGYDAQGNVTSITDAQGNVVTFTYDARGNLVKQEQTLFDGGKLLIERTYGSNNELLTETTYRDPGGQVGNGMRQPSGALTTHYVYDSRGLLRFAVTPEGRVTEYRYNAAGQQISAITYSGSNYVGTAYGETDLNGWVNTLSDKRQAIRTDTSYDFRGNVASTTQYSQLLANGEGDTSAAVTQTLYVYDPFGRLLQRYVGTPGAMQMQQFTYDGLGRLLTATDFAGHQTLYQYDDAHRQVSVTYANGLVRTTVTNLAGEVISLIESAQGNVLSQTFNTYDALGRLTQQVDANSGRTHYLYDAASRLVGEVGPDGAFTEYRYTPNGQIGETLRYVTPLSAAILASLGEDISGTSGLIGIGGPLIPPPTPPGTSLSANHVLDAIRPPSSANDRSDWRLYDQAGRLARSVDAAGIVTDYVYDGAGRLISSTTHTTPLDAAVLAAAAQEGSLSPQTGGALLDTLLDRTTRYLYDNDGLLRGQLDAEGYLTQYRYNAAGQRIETIRYATATPVSYRGNTTQLAEWLPAPSAQDIHTSYYYDSRGLLTTEVDGEGWLTTYTYDAYGNVASRIRGQRIDPAQGGAPQQVPIRFEASGSTGNIVEVWVDGVKVGSVTLTSADYTVYTLTASNLVPLINHTIELKGTNYSPLSVRNVSFGAQNLSNGTSGYAYVALYTFDALETLLAWATLPGQLEQTQYAYDADGRLLSVTQVGLEGAASSTTYTYDSQNRVTSETRDGRTLTYRYDLQGRLIGQLGGEGSAALAALGASASQAAIDAVWATYGVRYGYDAGGRRTSMTEANGATTLYYYNDANQLAAVINALGEVVAYTSDVFGNLTQTTVYASRVATGTLGTLVGGALTDDLRSLLQSLRSSEDHITQYHYTARGELATRTDALGVTTDYQYNTFGDLTGVTQQLDKNGKATTTRYTYDRLGQQTSQTTDAGGLNLITQAIYDAFGRVIETIDANGIHRTQQYDKNGQLIVVTDGKGQKTQLSYDAFGNVLTQTDANGHTTSFQYSAFNRQVTMTTAEGIRITTQYDSFGQVIALTDGNGNTTRYQYNRDGQLTQTTDALNNSTQQHYNAAGQLIDTVDARGTKTTYSYDAAGRVLTRTVDPSTLNPSGLNLTTRYDYNAMGEVIRVTDPAGTVTETRYDANGQTVAVIVDPNGLALTTTFVYDGAGNTVQVTEGAGSSAQKVTQYTYDNAGRLVQTQVDPNGLALTTTYVYDGNGNAVAVINANGAVTRYVYDANNQLALTVDATGTVTRNVVDAAGNVIARTQYANRIDLNGLGNALSEADITARLVGGTNDRVTRFAYDNDNRLRFTIDALGYVTEQRYDANGNVVRSVAYSAPVNIAGIPAAMELAAILAVPSYSNLPDIRYVDYVYDAANRLRYTVDSDFHVSEYTYDASGNQIARTGYFFTYNITGANGPRQTMADLQAWTATHKSLASDRTSLFFYDSANRLVYERDSANYVTAYVYDAAGRVTARTRYDDSFPAITATDTLASIATKLVNHGASTTQQRYDSAGRLTDVIDALGGITHHMLDTMGRVTATTVAYDTEQAVTTTRMFDAAGRAIEETRAAGTAIAVTTRYVYDALGQLTQVIDPRGVALITGPDSQALRDQRKDLGVVDSAGNGKGLDQLTEADIAKLLSYYTTSTVYDAVGNAIQTQSPYGAMSPNGPTYAVVNTTYDAFGNAVKVTDARGYSGYFYYDGNNRVIVHVDPDGYLTTTGYNAFGEPTTVSQYVNRVVGAFDEYTRPVASNTPINGPYVLAVSASDVAITKMTYDTAGRLLSATDAMGAEELYEYTSFGELMTFTNKLGAYSTYSYDKLGRLVTQTTQVAGHRNIIVAYSYDARGNRTRESTSEGGVILSDTYYTYDALDRQVAIKHPGVMVVPDGQTTAQKVDITETHRYDARGNLIERIDANGNRSVYYYDAANRLIGEVSATGAYTQYEYDAAGNRTRSLTWNNPVGLPVSAAALPAGSGAVREVQFTYDAANRLIQTFQPNVLTAAAGTAASNNTDYTTANGITRSWVYDANGQLVTQTDGNGHISRTWYDAVGNAVLSIDADGYGVAWTRDANGNVLNEIRFAQGYNGDASTLADPNAAIANWPRSADDRVTDYTYDKNGRMLSESRRSVVYGVVDANGNLVQQTGDAVTQYAYDKAGNLTKRIDANGAVYTFEYDDEGRLTATVSPSFTDYTGQLVQTRTEYVLDAMGRVVKETLKGSGAPDQVSIYTYDILGRLTAKTNALGQTTNMDYDAAGNLVQMRYTRTDSAGVVHNDVVAIQYDAANREVWRQTSEDGSTQGSPARRTQYNVYGEVTARGTGDTAWQETSEYDNAGRLIRSNAGDGITRIYLYDAEGNATMQFESQSLDLKALAILDANGNVNLDALYDPNVYPWLSWTLTTYDGRNQVTDVIQPTMAEDGTYLGLAPRPVAGGAPGQIGVEVGGPVGGTPQWPSISPSDALKTTPGAAALGPIFFGLNNWDYQRGQQNNYKNNWAEYHVYMPDLTSLFGEYEVLLTGANRVGESNYTGYGDSTQNPVAITITNVWAGGSRDNETLAVHIGVDIRVRSTGEVLHLGDFNLPAVLRYQGGRDLVADGGYNAEVKPSNLPQVSQLKLSPTDSSQLVGGIINAHIYARAGGNGPYTELPIRMGNLATVDLSSLNPGWVYDVVYIAERPDGSLARSEHYTLTAGDNPTISAADQTPEAAWNTFSGGTFIIADNALIGFNMRTSTNVPAPNATFRYRPVGAGDDAWSGNVQVGRIGFNGVRMPFDGIPDGTWEIDLSLCDANWNTLQHMTGQLTTGGAPTIALDYVHPAGNSITFTNIPLGADRVHLVLTNWIDGTPWDFGEFPITTPGTFAFDMPDWMLNQVAAWGNAVTFTVDATFTDDYIVPAAVYTAQGTLQAGTGRNPNSAINVNGNVYELNFNPLDDYGKPFDEGQYLLLRYWPEGADIVTHPELIQNVLILRSPDGQYHWDSIGLDPNQSYAYYYDVYRTLEEAQNPGEETELTRNEGYFTPANQATGTEWQWVIDNVHNDAVTIHRHQSYNAFGEVNAETDGRGNTVELYYNTLGHLTLKRDPLVAITYANGYQASIRPETSYSYDRTGRLVGQIDANGNRTTQIWNDGTGTVAQEFRADGGTTVYQYDVFGNQRVKIDALDIYSVNAASARRTDYSYDAGGNLIRIERPAVKQSDGTYARAVDTYTYDEFGRRLTHTNSVTGTDTVDYDPEGNVSKIVSAAGRVTTYTHAWDGSLYGGQGGWVQTTRLPYNPGDNAYGQSVLIDVSTAFGQTTQHTDIAGRVTEYLYYFNGLLKQQGATQYTYYNNGLLHSMVDTENGTRGYYEYDNNGNLIFEGFTGKSGNWAFQQSVACYDELNRLVEVKDPRYNIVYEYDAVGNRIHMRSEYNDAFGQPNQVQDYWYAYDQMNRFTTTMGQLSNGRGQSATDTSTFVYQGNGGDGVSIGYNAFGERMYATYASDGHTERYEYDAQGYLTTTTLYNPSGTAFAQTLRTNDLAGRVQEYVEVDLLTNRVMQSVQHTWDNDSLLLRDRVVAWDVNATDDQGNSAPRYTITVTTTNRLADGTVSSTFTDYDGKNDGSSPHTYITTTYEYVWFDSAKQSTIKVQASNQDVKGWAPGLSAFEYDSFGRIKAAYDVEGGRGFAYQTDGEGRILQRDELLGQYDEASGRIINATSNRWHAYYYLDDRQIGNVGNDGVERIDYAQELAQRAQTSNSDSQHKRFKPVAGADFDGNYLPINSLYPTAAPGSYIVHAGDTLTSIAMALWGDSSLWWILADANGLSLNEPLIPNTVLTVPNKVTNIHNNASTFKPYDAGKAIGDTNPTIPNAPPPPPPPGKKGCGGLLQVVAIAVAVVVTIYSAGVASGAGFGLMSAMSAGASAFAGGTIGIGAALAAGAAGAIASQGVLVAGGVQEGFNWKGVAMSAVGSAATAGVLNSSVGQGISNSFVQGAVQGGLSAAATGVVGSVTGMQSFSWKNIAAGAVSSGVARGVSRNLPGAANGIDKATFGNQLASNLAGGIGSAAVYGNLSQQALMGTTMNAIASTIGNSIADQMANRKLPNIDINPRDVVDPITFNAQSLQLDPYKLTFAQLGPIQMSASLAGVTGQSLGTTYKMSLEDVQGYVLPAPYAGFAIWGEGVGHVDPIGRPYNDASHENFGTIWGNISHDANLSWSDKLLDYGRLLAVDAPNADQIRRVRLASEQQSQWLLDLDTAERSPFAAGFAGVATAFGASASTSRNILYSVSVLDDGLQAIGGMREAQGAVRYLNSAEASSYGAWGNSEIVDGARAIWDRKVGLVGDFSVRAFTTNDPGVGPLIDAIEARAPGTVKQAEIKIYRPDGTAYTDFDIVTDTHVIQVKVGTGKGIVPQIQQSQQLTNLKVIGFDANGITNSGQSFKPSVMRNAQQNGITIVNNVDDLMRAMGK